MSNTFLNNLEWRIATKNFASEKKIPESHLKKILTAIRMAPSSFGLQPIHVFVIGKNRLRAQLRQKSFLQAQVMDASYLLIFCARTDVRERINDFFQRVSCNDNMSKSDFNSRRLYVSSRLTKKTPKQLIEWSKQQVYIALGFALAACAELKIDSCPMSGFEPDEVDKILDLPGNIKSTVYLAIGYREGGGLKKKVRFSGDDLFTYVM